MDPATRGLRFSNYVTERAPAAPSLPRNLTRRLGIVGFCEIERVQRAWIRQLGPSWRETALAGGAVAVR